MVERRLGLDESLCRSFGSFTRLDVSLDDAREETAGEDGATGRYCDEDCLDVSAFACRVKDGKT